MHTKSLLSFKPKIYFSLFSLISSKKKKKKEHKSINFDVFERLKQWAYTVRCDTCSHQSIGYIEVFIIITVSPRKLYLNSVCKKFCYTTS